MAKIKFSPKQRKIIKLPFDTTLDVLEGTPRSGKTTAAVFRYAHYLIRSRDENHLVVGYNQEQAYRLFFECDGLGLLYIFDGYSKLKHSEQGPHLETHTPNGTKRVFYKGGGKADSHKRIQGMSLGSVAFLEIDLLHMDMIQECFRRTYAATDRYHLADLNPPPPNHPVIREIFDVQNTRWQHWTIHDNPIISEERRKEIYETVKKSKYLLDRDWYGKRVVPQGVIYSMFDFDRHIQKVLRGKPYEMYFSADAGHGDATTVSCNIVTWLEQEKKFVLNRVANYYHSGNDTGQVKAMSTYAKEIKEFVRWCSERFEMQWSEFFVDPAARSLREELRLEGIETRPANNNAKDIKGSKKGIEVGIERLQNMMSNEQFMLVDTDRYDHYHFLKEIGLYSRDDSGRPIDKYNHAADECRYSANYFYRRYIL